MLYCTVWKKQWPASHIFKDVSLHDFLHRFFDGFSKSLQSSAPETARLEADFQRNDFPPMVLGPNVAHPKVGGKAIVDLGAKGNRKAKHQKLTIWKKNKTSEVSTSNTFRSLRYLQKNEILGEGNVGVNFILGKKHGGWVFWGEWPRDSSLRNGSVNGCRMHLMSSPKIRNLSQETANCNCHCRIWF